MAHTSTRLGLNEIDAGTDAVSAWPLLQNANMATLDNSVLLTEGTLAGRPAANAVEHGHVYHATDTFQWFQSDGTNWGTVLVANAWSSLTRAASVSAVAGSNSSRARLVGDTVCLSGRIQNGSVSALPSGYGILTGLPAALSPSQNIGMAVNAVANGGASSVALSLEILAGQTSFYFDGGSWPSGNLLSLEGLSYPLS